MASVYVLNGPYRGQSYEINDRDFIYVGRSTDNHMQIKDRAVSRRHLKIIRKGKRFFLKDLKSRNGTHIQGEEIESDIEVEIQEGVPIVIGMSIICLGEHCLDQFVPVLDSIGLSSEVDESGKTAVLLREKTVQKNMELVYKVSEVLTQSLDINELIENVIDNIFDLFKRIDRALIILVDSKSWKISKAVYRVRNPEDDPKKISWHIVKEVLRYENPIVVTNTQDAEESGLSEILKLSNIGSAVCLPLISQSEKYGVIYMDSIEKQFGFRKEDLSLLGDLSRRTALAIENASLYKDL